MDSKEILGFCLKNGLLIDKEALGLFSDTDADSAKFIIERIKERTSSRVITKGIFFENNGKIGEFFSEIPEDKKENLQKLKIKLGLSIEISKSSQEIPKSQALNVSQIAAESGSTFLKDEKRAKSKFDEQISTSPREVPQLKFGWQISNERELKINSDSCVKVVSTFPVVSRSAGVKDFVNYFRNRYSEMKFFLQERPELTNLLSINKISGNRQGISIIGMVSDKKMTKNKNILFDVEDITGKIKVLISESKKELYEKAQDICLDSVLGFKCTGNREILFANEIIFPEANLYERKKSAVEEYALFIGDVHYGSKNFLEKDFLKFIDYLNGKVENIPEVSKIKYLFIVGDLITGIGNYPNQEPDLKFSSLEEQFEGIADLLKQIRKDIKIILSPGNHDCVRLMEPQPLLDERYAWPLYELENVIITGNPSLVKIGETKYFEGFKILTYHGFSFPYYANTVPDLVSEKAMNHPEKIMKFLLKHRHLAPTHASTQYFPLEKDALLIGEIPDIFVSGHTHKSGITHFNNILLISVSSWEGLTAYQEKFGNKPDHCKVPMLNLKTRQVKMLDFETGDDGIKLYMEEE